MHTNSAIAVFVNVLLFGSSVLALPQYAQNFTPEDKCRGQSGTDEYEFKDVEQKEYDGDAEFVTGTTCDSPCSITKAYTWSKGTTITVGGATGGTDVASKLWKFLAGSSFTPSYSWTTTKGEMTSASLECPFDKQGVTCGVQAKPKMAHITGQTRHKVDAAACNGLDDIKEWKDLDVHAPVTRKTWERMDTGADGADDIAVEFSSCVTACDSQELCFKAREKGYDLCPGVEKPDDWDLNIDVDALWGDISGSPENAVHITRP